MLKYILIIIASFAIGFGIAYDQWNGKYKNYVKAQELNNQQAQWEFERQRKDYEGAKEEADEEYKTNITELNSQLSSLYDSRQEAIRHYKQQLASSTNELNRVSIERDELLSAIQQFDEEVYSIIEQCDGDRIRLNNLKRWSDVYMHMQQGQR